MTAQYLMSYLQRLQQIRDLRFKGGTAQRVRDGNLVDMARQHSTRNLCDRIEEGAGLKDIQALLAKVPLEPPAVVRDVVNKREILSKPGHDEFPLMVAIGCQRTDVAALLLDHGADPNVYGSPFNPLMCALAQKALECVPLLLRAGARPVVMWKTPAGTDLNAGVELLAGCAEHCASHPEALEAIGAILNSGYEINNMDLNTIVFQCDNFHTVRGVMDLAHQRNYTFERFTHLPKLIERFCHRKDFDSLFQNLLDWGAHLDAYAIRDAIHANSPYLMSYEKQEFWIDILEKHMARTQHQALCEELNCLPTSEVSEKKPRKI